MHASIDRSAEYTRPRGRLVADGGEPIEGGASTGPRRRRVRRAGHRGRQKIGAAVPTSLPTSVPQNLSTEQAVTVFGALAGVGGFFAQVLAANRLSQIPGDSVALRSLAPSVIVLSVAVVLAARFIPAS